MTINCYTNNSPPNKIGKTLVSVGTYTGYLRDSCSITAPTFTLETNSLPVNVNYFYVVEYDRYYFVDTIVLNINGLYEIHGSVDVVESFKTEILNLTGIIERQENVYDMYLADPIFRTDQNTHTQFFEFDNGFGSTPTILLSTI